ncbi:hypothetical protein MtrunA17_Chr5g0398921 [Medicago truncatula]|uniref:Uncharacterized protein n=1 Tax=Medicago truncatula TaxID=3880 RepID=A0A396HK59_MEDTR|nr:hypothetical protein MtrunA17_Chr5g0398921 [Medicago truncatula]
MSPIFTHHSFIAQVNMTLYKFTLTSKAITSRIHRFTGLKA